MKPELSYIDLSRIDTYVERMGVEFYDVRVEIVDHIASIMEQQIANQPHKPFKQIFDETLAQFDNFDYLVAEKQEQVARQYNRYFWQSMGAFFSWPKIVFTFLLIWGIYSILEKMDAAALQNLEESFFLTYLIPVAYVLFFHWRNNKEVNKLTTSNHVIWYFWLITISHIFNILTRFVEDYHQRYTLLFATIYGLTILLVWAVVASYEKLRSYGRNKYLAHFN